jgi:site-specific DNA-methyltransferase (adenine-specific)
MDFFAGSGTFGEAALEFDRKFILVDNNPQALEVMKKRFAKNPKVVFDTHMSLPIKAPLQRQPHLL